MADVADVQAFNARVDLAGTEHAYCDRDDARTGTTPATVVDALDLAYLRWRRAERQRHEAHEGVRLAGLRRAHVGAQRVCA